MRGFILSIVAILFLAFLFMIATSLHTNYLSLERALLFPQPMSYADFAADQAAYELNSIMGPAIAMYPDNSSFLLVIRQDVPAKNMSHMLSDYEKLLEQDLAEQSHATIQADLSNLSDGAYEMSIADAYRFSNSQEGQMAFRGAGGDSGAYAYEINITVPKHRLSLAPFGSGSQNGINTTINYLDLNGTYAEEVVLDPSDASEFFVMYSDNSTLTVLVGRESGDDGSLLITTANATAQVSWSAMLPPLNQSQMPAYSYDAWITYSSGPFTVSRKIST